ncbi:hypothetical protein WR25_24174 [Diploscapter pachys]|uniref:Secreted protein n=1 Tax=Diploscapter pachys TaxID=2018661 RepID=A0A2A2KZ84_9BILA|nr:hypothetical protein WR25_24174 [Diploscapter pachys]
MSSGCLHRHLVPCACACLPAFLAWLSLPVCPLFTAPASLLQAEHKGRASTDLCSGSSFPPSSFPRPAAVIVFPLLLVSSFPSRASHIRTVQLEIAVR